MKLKQTPVDLENLPKGEVLAVNDQENCLIGYLSIESRGIWTNPNVMCDDENTVLDDVTHYITVSDLIQQLKNQ